MADQLNDIIERLRAYSARRKKAKGISVDHIHGFDASPEGGFELRLSDIDAVLDRVMQQERIGALLVDKETREGVMFYSTDMLPDPTTFKDRFQLVDVYTYPAHID